MLDIITKSKTRQKILLLMFASADKSFYLSEIARIINTSIGTTQRELNNLYKAGLVISVKKANLRYYFLDKKNPLFAEIKAIVNNTIGLETELRKLIKKNKNIKFALIFGSFVKGDFTSDSDIDILIIGDINETDWHREIVKLEKSINREINYHLYNVNDFKAKAKASSFIKNIISNYKLLTNNEDEFRALIK